MSMAKMSTPLGSVPSQCPGENGGSPGAQREAVGPGGIVKMYGQTKQKKSSRMRIAAGTHSRSARPTFCHFSRRLLTRDGSGCCAPGASVAVSGSCAAIPDPWVEDRVQQVGDEVACHGHQGEHDDDALHQRQVVDVDGVDQLRADAREREDLLQEGAR